MIRRMSTPAFLRIIVCIATACALAGCSGLFFQALNSGQSGAEPRSVDFAPTLSLDVYPPLDAGEPAPVVVFFYGGTWRDGEREAYRFVGNALAESGALVIIPDYRKYPQVRFPTFMDDAARAVAWAHANAAAHGGDPGHIVLAGHSAGGHIAALLATDRSYLRRAGVPDRAIGGLVGLAGAYDFLPSEDEDLVAIFGADPDQQARSQPVNFVSGNEPPTLLLHGTGDRLVEVRNSRRFAQSLTAHDVDVELIELEGVGHIRLLAALRANWLGEVLPPLVRFVERTAAPGRRD